MSRSVSAVGASRRSAPRLARRRGRRVSHSSAPAPPAGAALAALAQPPRAASLASQRIYFVMPDRYANGDPANDRAG